MRFTRKENMRRLAIAYNGLMTERDDLSQVVWGEMLQQAQIALGVDVVGHDTLDRIIKAARARRAEIKNAPGPTLLVDMLNGRR